WPLLSLRCSPGRTGPCPRGEGGALPGRDSPRDAAAADGWPSAAARRTKGSCVGRSFLVFRIDRSGNPIADRRQGLEIREYRTQILVGERADHLVGHRRQDGAALALMTACPQSRDERVGGPPAEAGFHVRRQVRGEADAPRTRKGRVRGRTAPGPRV